jgi:peptidoglycan/LPS O-acetylase OafA/YrhL
MCGAFYLSNLTPLFGIPIAYPVLWSLAVEVHFYFLVPAAERKFRNKTLIGMCFAIVILTPVSRLLTFSNRGEEFLRNLSEWL